MSDQRIAWLMLVAVCAAALAVGVWFTLRPTPSRSPSLAVATPTPRCHSLNGLPDPICTPGAIDPRVSQNNIQSTICTRGYTATVRPSARYTDTLKVQQISAYGYSDTTPADYEEDHLIPLELGGHPTDPKNLWPESRNGEFPASRKDTIENRLHSEVCSDKVSLDLAQKRIAQDWETAA